MATMLKLVFLFFFLPCSKDMRFSLILSTETVGLKTWHSHEAGLLTSGEEETTDNRC